MATETSVIEIRNIKEISELRAVEDLQKKVWGCNDREILPSLALIPLLEIGAVLMGAFSGAEMVGFVLGLPGLERGRPVLHSDMLAVKAEYRSHGLGYKLKLRQREQALAKGIDRITWTFDPLQSRNAHLNFTKLGVIAERYKINYYGETSSSLHRTGTDRLWVTWVLESDLTKERLERGSVSTESSDLVGVPMLVRAGEDNEPILLSDLRAERLAIEIPAEIDSLVEDDIALALRWREATRRAFTDAFEAGYVTTGFYRGLRGTQRFGAYLLRQGKVL